MKFFQRVGLAFCALLLTAGPQSIWAQDDQAPLDNYTVLRLIVVNDSSQVLVAKSEFGWMTPATRYTTRQTISEVLDSLATTFGLHLENPKLAGLFTYTYRYNDRVSTRQFYFARAIDSALTLPPEMSEGGWMSKNDAVAKLRSTVPSLAQMTNQVVSYPETLWGGSFELNRINGVLGSTVTEGFYPLR